MMTLMTQSETYETDAFIDEAGHLQLDLPEAAPRGRVRVTIAPMQLAAPPLKPLDEMTEAEIDAELALPWEFKGQTAGEILASGVLGHWYDEPITDSSAFVETLRRENDESRNLR